MTQKQKQNKQTNKVRLCVNTAVASIQKVHELKQSLQSLVAVETI